MKTPTAHHLGSALALALSIATFACSDSSKDDKGGGSEVLAKTNQVVVLDRSIAQPDTVDIVIARQNTAGSWTLWKQWRTIGNATANIPRPESDDSLGILVASPDCGFAAATVIKNGDTATLSLLPAPKGKLPVAPERLAFPLSLSGFTCIAPGTSAILDSSSALVLSPGETISSTSTGSTPGPTKLTLQTQDTLLIPAQIAKAPQWTLQFWMRGSDWNAQGNILRFGNIDLALEGGWFRLNSGEGNSAIATPQSGTTWYAIALRRSANEIEVLVDGDLVASAILDDSLPNADIRIGGMPMDITDLELQPERKTTQDIALWFLGKAEPSKWARWTFDDKNKIGIPLGSLQWALKLPAGATTLPWNTGTPLVHSLKSSLYGPNADAEEDFSGNLVLGDKDLDLGIDDSTGKPNARTGLYFEKLPIPQGAKIINTQLVLFPQKPTSDAAALVVQVNDNISPYTFDTKGTSLADMPTVNALSWTPRSWGSDTTTAITSPNFSYLLQRLVASPSWQDNSNIAVLIRGTGHRSIHSYESDPARAPYLIISWVSK